LNRHLQELIELSKLDKAIDDFNPIVENLQKKLDRRREKKEEIENSKEEIEKSIQELREKINSYENQIKVLKEQLENSAKKEKLVKSEKELKAIQTETELAKEKISFINEEIERLNKIIDNKLKELQELEEKLQKAKEDYEKFYSEYMERMEQIEKERRELFLKRDAKIRTIDQKILAFYEKIRLWSKNTAVVPVRKQACYGCYMKLNDSAYAEVIKSEEICTCHHCGRIIYVEPATAEV
jgi:predicted  nucleic acid-binding Zn-ribbon protein